MSTTNPFAKYTDPAASSDQDNPFAKYVQPVAAPAQPKRSLWTAINDNVIEVANAAAGNASAVANFVRPGNAASQWIDKNFIEAGNAKQSDVVKAEKARYAQEMEQAQGFGDEVSSTLGYVARNPLLAAAQAAGSFAGPGLAVGGARAAAGALGMGAKAATRTGLAAGAGFGTASAGGDAAGTAYELSRQGGATDEQALDAARGASVIPGAIGAAGGLVGAERLVAGAKGFGGGLTARALKTGAAEGAQEALEEGVTQYEGQRAAVPFNPELDPTKGVAGAATMGAVLGGTTGGGASLLTGQNQPARKPSEDLGLNPDSGPISKVAAAAVDEGRAAAPMQPEQAAQPEDGLSLAPEEQAQPQGPTMEERLAVLPEQARAQADQLLREIADERVPAGVKRFRANELQQLLDAYPVPESTDTFNPEDRAAMGPIVRGYDPATGEAPGRPLELEGERYQDGIDFATDEQPSQNAYQDEINRIALESYQTPGQPLAMEQAGRLRDAAREQGIPATIVPHPSGRGFDVQATAVLPEAARQQVAQDPVAAALPYDNSPTGRMVADTQGNARPELRPEAVGREVGWNQELAQMEADVRQSEALGMSNLRERIDAFRQKQAEVASMARQANPPTQAGAVSAANTAMQPKEGRILQNRDRSTPGSIEQMQRIAAAPDYGRLGFSRDFANGAPVVTDANIDSSQLGRADIAVASDGRRIPVQYAVVEADTVLPSNRVDGSPNAEYATAADRMRAIAGNGRIAGLQAAAQRGTNGQYVQELANDTMHGINPQVIAAMRAPVLVRIMPQEQVTDDIGDVSNTTGNLQLSAVEQSRNDAQRVDLSVLEFAEDGGVTAKAVRQFVQAMPQAERGALLDVNGQPTKQAVDRLHAAVFSSAYGNDQLVRLYAQAQDPEARLILSALAKLAPKFARLEGAGALDIRPIVTQAAEIAVNARRNGTPLAQAAQQLDIAADPLVGVVLKLFAQNPRSNKLVIEKLGNAADMAYTEAFKPDADMFGPVPRATREQVMNQLEPQNEQPSTQNLEQPAGREPVPADVIGQPTAGAAQPGGAATEAGTAAAAGQQQDAETVAPTAIQQTNSQRNVFESAVGQAQTATNNLPANPQEKVPPAATGQSDAKVGDAVRVTQTFLDGKNGSFDGKVSFVYSNGHMAVIRDDTGNDEVVRSADVQRLTDGEAAQGNVQEGQPQAQQAQDGNGAMFSRSDAKPVTNPTAVKMRRAMVQRTVDALAKGWAKAPNVTVVDGMQDERVPEAVRKADAAQRSQGAMGEPEGFWYRGQVYLVASALPTSADAARVLYHEVLGHHGLRGHFGKDLDRVLDQVIKLRRKDVQAKAQEYGLDMDDPKHAGYAAEEVLAELAQSRPDLGFVQRAIAAIRNFLRTHVPGFKVLELTDADIVQGYLLPARGWVERGGVSSAVNGDTRFSFAGERANTADTMALATAQQRLDAGENAEIVRQETGWHKGADGKWRFEINDADAKYIGKEAMEQAAENDPYKMAEMRLEEVLDHPALFAAYPGLRDVSVAYEASSAADGDLYYGANYNAEDNVITIGNGLDEATQLSALLHEIQHGIQNIEGFATGGNEDSRSDVMQAVSQQRSLWADVYAVRRDLDAGKKLETVLAEWQDFLDARPSAEALRIAQDPELETAVALQNMETLERQYAQLRNEGRGDTYRRLAGEVEARNTQARQGMNDAQRRATPPSQTADVADSDVIVTFNGKQAASAPAPANAGVRFSRSGSPDATDQTQTAAFKRWFGDWEATKWDGASVVREPAVSSRSTPQDMPPKVVYHGTRKDFASFAPVREGNVVTMFGDEDTVVRRGIFFAENPEFAATFAAQSGEGSPQVMPVYLNIRNPMFLEDGFASEYIDELAAAGFDDAERLRHRKPEMVWAEFDDEVGEQFVAAAKAAGYDGVYMREQGRGLDGEEDQFVWVAFDPEQVKSATGNNGNFDPANPDIRFSRSAAPSLSEVAETGRDTAWTGPAASKWDDFIYKMQDKHIDTKRALEAVRATGKAVSDELDVYLQEELYHGRAAKRTEDFVKQELEPLLQYMSSAGLKMADVEEYLHARHAKEANAVIAQRNPSLPDGGSGMTNAEADAVLEAYAPMRLKLLEKAAAQVDAIIAGTRNTFVEYGLESQDVVDGWAQSFAHYVPLMREQEGDGMAGLGTGQGFSVKGKEVKGRTGSTKKVVDILANIAMQRERAIVRGEKNRVAAALVGLAKAHPSDFWKVDVVPTRQVLGKDGMVKTEHDPLYKQRDNVVVAKIPELDAKTGKVLVKEHAVLFNENDARALRMAQALKNLDAAQLEGMLGATAKVTRYLAAINTQYNPIFGIVNLVRDVQGAAINLQSTALAGRQGEVLTQTVPALRGIYSEMRSQRKGSTTGTQWSKLWEEFQEVGGQTGYRDQFRTSADRGQAIGRALDPSSWAETNWGRFFTAGGRLKVPLEMVRKTMAPVLNWLDDYNTAMENGVRLAAYKAGLDAGLSKERAASIAKNLTTNFNRKGQVAQQVGALYAFFNASMQGTARIGEALFAMEPGQPKTLRLSALGRKVVSGGVLLGAGQALMLAAAGFGDDEPPEHVRERNLVIPLGGKRYATIPLPLGLHVLPNLGRIPTEFALGGFKNPAEQVLKVAGLFADAFNPVGNSGLSMQTLVPTVLDPLAALAENQDFAGREIAKKSFNPITPGHALARDTATAHAKLIAEAINFLSGGTAHVRGALSPTPDQIDYLIGQFTGGVGRELSKLQQSVVGAAQGDDVPAHKVPVLGRFYGDANSPSAKQAAFYNHLDNIARHAEQVKGLRLEGEAQAANTYLQEHPEARLALAAKATSRAIQKMREQRRELEQQGAAREQVRQIEEQMTARMEQFNAQVERAMQ